MAHITLDLFRYDPAVDEEPHRERVDIDFPDTSTVLDALEYAKAEVDGSISFRRSCRSAICGSCSMNINGVTGLACKTPIRDVMRSDNSVKIDP
ncbi:MAG: 2Fe-2S iron-sulfur cluster binding domain-containing protein, partial [Candidatus Eremiobacteraeota bacterium]|nr:2Fe-2S iron-sulfur cluster binding domain-containing protein [Candidatus Eremiobacteraeota bacterium]